MDTRPFVEHLKLLAEAQRRKLEELRVPIVQAEKDLEHIIGMIDFYARNASAQSSIVVPPTAVTLKATITPNLRGLSHKQAVIAIAKFYGGVIKAQYAKRLMIEAGVMSNTKNSTRMVHNAIINSDRFERIAPGEFRLKPIGIVLKTAPTARPATTEDMARMVEPSKPVQ
jgi:hypothetical protein